MVGGVGVAEPVVTFKWSMLGTPAPIEVARTLLVPAAKLSDVATVFHTSHPPVFGNPRSGLTLTPLMLIRSLSPAPPPLAYRNSAAVGPADGALTVNSTKSPVALVKSR